MDVIIKLRIKKKYADEIEYRNISNRDIEDMIKSEIENLKLGKVLYVTVLKR